MTLGTEEEEAPLLASIDAGTASRDGKLTERERERDMVLSARSRREKT